MDLWDVLLYSQSQASLMVRQLQWDLRQSDRRESDGKLFKTELQRHDEVDFSFLLILFFGEWIYVKLLIFKNVWSPVWETGCQEHLWKADLIFFKMLSFHPAFHPLPCFPSYPPTLLSQQSLPFSHSSTLSFFFSSLKHASSCSMFALLLHLYFWYLAIAHIRSSVRAAAERQKIPMSSSVCLWGDSLHSNWIYCM